MVRPTKDGRQVAVRLPDDLLARVDARVEALKAQGGLLAGVTRSDVIREAVAAHMNAVERGEEQRPTAQKGKAKR
jgi:Arc/MetJ-type ribon-helix-helix transcriptional regulator